MNVEMPFGAMSLVAVADGMGGHAGGGTASRVAIAVLHEHWESWVRAGIEPDAQAAIRLLTTAFDSVDRQIRDRAAVEDELSGMGTTLVAALAVRDRFMIANLGDSRAYAISQDEVRRLTLDHSSVEERMRSGLLSELDAMRDPFRHALTRSLDGHGDSTPDIYPTREGWFVCDRPTVVLVCSDGVSGVLGEIDLLEAIVTTPDLGRACQSVLGSAYEAGSQDNMSVGLLELGDLKRAIRSGPQVRVPGPGIGSRSGKERSPRSMRLRAAVITLVIAAIALLFARFIPSTSGPTEELGSRDETAAGTHGGLQSTPSDSSAGITGSTDPQRTRQVPGARPDSARRGSADSTHADGG